MVDTTLTVGIDTGPAEIGARRLGRVLSGVSRNVGSTGSEIDRMTAQVAGASGALAQFSSEGRQTEIAFDRMSRRSMEMGRAVMRGSNDFVRGAQAIRQATDAVSTEIRRVPRPTPAGAFKQRGPELDYDNTDLGGADFWPTTGVGSFGRGALGWASRNGRRVGRLAPWLFAAGDIGDETAELLRARDDILSVIPPGNYLGMVENDLLNVALSTGTTLNEIAPLYSGLGEIPGFAKAHSQVPQLIENLLRLNGLNGNLAEDQVPEVMTFINRSHETLADGASAFDELTAGAMGRDEELDALLTELASQMAGGDLTLPQLAMGLSSRQDLIDSVVQDARASNWKELFGLLPNGLPGLVNNTDNVLYRVPSLVAAPAAEGAFGLGSEHAYNPYQPPPRLEPGKNGYQYDSFRALDEGLVTFDRARRWGGISIADMNAALQARGLDGSLGPVRVPVELAIGAPGKLTEEQMSEVRDWADRAMVDLQADHDNYLPQITASMMAGQQGDAMAPQGTRLAESLSGMTEATANSFRLHMVPILGDDARITAEKLVEVWRHAYFEELTEGFGAPGEELPMPLAPMPDSGRFKRQGSRDGIDLGYRDVGQSILDGQLASSVVTADMLPVGGPEGVVPTSEEIELLMAKSEALRAQSGVLDEGYTPATKGAAEATLELADAAVGLDAALKSPDPMAVAEDMEELSALGQQVGNSFASAFERAVFSGEELSDVLSALALDLARLVLQQQVLGPLAGGIGGLFDDIIGGLFGVTGVGSSVGGVTQGGSTSLHTGGLVEHGAPLSRAIAPSVWLGASRYHFGGLAGDEVPAILRRGEEVLTRDDPRHRANAGLGGGRAGGGVAIHQTISIDAKAVNENGVDGAAADAVGRQMRAAVRSAVQAEIAQQSRVGGMLNRV